VADETTNTPTERDFTKMSVQELNNLVIAEGRKFIEQTKDGDIAVEDYIESENFSLTRLMNLFFAFDYFERTEHGNVNKNFGGEYSELYIQVYAQMSKIMGDKDIYPGYIYQ
jgi:hypothetical protein